MKRKYVYYTHRWCYTADNIRDQSKWKYLWVYGIVLWMEWKKAFAICLKGWITLKMCLFLSCISDTQLAFNLELSWRLSSQRNGGRVFFCRYMWIKANPKIDRERVKYKVEMILKASLVLLPLMLLEVE